MYSKTKCFVIGLVDLQSTKRIPKTARFVISFGFSQMYSKTKCFVIVWLSKA